MNKHKASINTSGLIKNLHPGYSGETIVADKDGIRSVPFEQLDERTQRKFARDQNLIESYVPCFEFSEQHEFIKPPKSPINQ